MASYIVDIYDGDLVWLAYASGIAQGAGNTAAAESLFGILNRLQVVGDDNTEYAADAPEEAEAEVVPIRTPDPQFTPPIPDPPQTRQDDFGAGPVPVL